MNLRLNSICKKRVAQAKQNIDRISRGSSVSAVKADIRCANEISKTSEVGGCAMAFKPHEALDGFRIRHFPRNQPDLMDGLRDLSMIHLAVISPEKNTAVDELPLDIRFCKGELEAFVFHLLELHAP